MTVYNSVIELIGNTPLVRLNRLKAHLNLNADILLKLEMFNPAGSVKDRAALYMVNDFLKRGIIKPGSTLIEPTSGNTGIGLALVARAYGLKLILTMPDSMSIERRQLLKARGAELVLTPGKLGMQGAVDEAIRLQASTPGSVIPSQFSNPANPKSHEETTAEEIWRDTEGQIDIIIAGVGTGGTITGLARGLKKHNKNLIAVAVEPAESPLITKGVSGPHKIQGIGANFIPDNYDKTVVDEVLDIPSDTAYENAILLNRIEGILAGISAGGNLAAAIELARRPENAGKTIVAIAPDTGEHYLSLNLFN
ncbi:MAG: cysteine synthase A [Succinivibrionaceae bacterium]|nr:cysteine synthase A [Succinivibrionaceae bacterium]